MIRKASAVWNGTGRAGSGHLSTDSGVLAQTP
jgi:osmotically inducible protein OsmC